MKLSANATQKQYRTQKCPIILFIRKSFAVWFSFTSQHFRGSLFGQADDVINKHSFALENSLSRYIPSFRSVIFFSNHSISEALSRTTVHLIYTMLASVLSDMIFLKLSCYWCLLTKQDWYKCMYKSSLQQLSISIHSSCVSIRILNQWLCNRNTSIQFGKLKSMKEENEDDLLAIIFFIQAWFDQLTDIFCYSTKLLCMRNNQKVRVIGWNMW